MGDGGGDIIIKGGSVRLHFDNLLFQNDSLDPNTYKHEGRSVTRVRVEDEDGKSMFDSEYFADGLKWTIKVSTE